MKNKMDKAKNKAKNKVAAKVGKKLGKNARECAKAAVVLVAFAALAALLTGCATTGEQPARSQTMTNKFRDCVIIANARSVALDTKAKTLDADADTMSAPLELWTQTQANEGSETISPTATPTNTTDTDASLDIPLAKTGAASAGTSVVDAIAAGVKAFTSTDAPAGSADAASATSDCPDCVDPACADCEFK